MSETTQAPAALIETRELSYHYTEENNISVPVLEDITLTVNRGDFIAVLGHNGSGKSTLAKHFNALLLPCGGKAYVDGMDTADEALTYEIRRQVGLVLQNPDNQIVATIVEEDVAFAPENLGLPSEEIRRRVDAALESVGMSEFRDNAPFKLSGGQKQRIAIAGILAMEPSCIVLDEPTAMLDPKGRREVIDTIMRLNREKGTTIILITHYMDEATRAQKVYCMDKGRILIEGTPAEVFSQVDTLKSIRLDVPQATELCHLLRQEGWPLPEGILSDDDCVEAISAFLECKSKEQQV